MSIDPNDVARRLAQRLCDSGLVIGRPNDPWLFGPCLLFAWEIAADLMRAQRADAARERRKSLDEYVDELALRSTATQADLAEMAAALVAIRQASSEAA